tara:strand:- start:429 stop:1127 length:699 start_codon:yes stop_codon:yes gene_type:complete
MKNRILIKLSGEALSHGGSDYNTDMFARVATQIQQLTSQGVQVAIVVGGGNLFRGRDLVDKISVERPTADYIGMLAIVQNALVLRDYFESQKIDTRVISAISMRQVCEPYIPKRVERHMDKGRVVILAAGLGQPYFSSDTTCVQRALELGISEVVMAKHGVDAVYTADPNVDSSAEKIEKITATKVIESGLSFADQAAISLARENALPIRVIGMQDIESIRDLSVGTRIIPE